MRATISRVLAVLALACACALIAITAGIFPKFEAEAPKLVPLGPPPKRVVAKAEAEKPKAVEPVIIDALALCEAPASGAALFRVELLGDASAFVVWCKGGYELFALEPGREGALVATRLARFSSRAALPAGVLSYDASGDGTIDFVLGVSPSEGVVHAPFSGVFLVRGRPQGGYESAITLLEMPVSALLEADFDGDPSRDLFVVTRGDVPARRPSELWWLTGAPVPALKHKMAIGLDVRALVSGRVDGDEKVDLVALVRGENKVLGLRHDEGALIAPIAIAGPADVLELIAPIRSLELLARTTRDVGKLVAGAEPKIEPWLKDANLGVAAAADLDFDGAVDVLAQTTSGLTMTRGPLEEHVHDLEPPPSMTVRDVAVLSLGAGKLAGAVLFESTQTPPRLLLGILPTPLWPQTTQSVLREGSTRDAQARAEIALE